MLCALASCLVHPSILLVFFFSSCGDLRDLHSFPTRRSSDLGRFSHPAFAGRNGNDIFNAGEGLLVLLLSLTDRKSTRLNSSHVAISYAVFCLKKKNKTLNAPAFVTQKRPACTTQSSSLSTIT